MTTNLQTITIKKSSLNKRLRKPLTLQVPTTTDKVSLDIQRYIIDSLSSRAPRLISFALRNQSILKLAEYFKYERSASPNSITHYTYTIEKFSMWANLEPDDLIAEVKTNELMNLAALPKAVQRLDRYWRELCTGDYAPHSRMDSPSQELLQSQWRGLAFRQKTKRQDGRQGPSTNT